MRVEIGKKEGVQGHHQIDSTQLDRLIWRVSLKFWRTKVVLWDFCFLFQVWHFKVAGQDSSSSKARVLLPYSNTHLFFYLWLWQHFPYFELSLINKNKLSESFILTGIFLKANNFSFLISDGLIIFFNSLSFQSIWLGMYSFLAITGITMITMMPLIFRAREYVMNVHIIMRGQSIVIEIIVKSD